MIAALCLVLFGADPDLRYIYVPTQDVYDHIIVDWAVNMVMNTATTQVPTKPVGKLVQIDLKSLAKDEKDYINLVNNWNKLVETEPYFTELQPAFISYKASDGKTYTKQQGFKRTYTDTVEYRWFLKKILSTTEGGLYYQFRGVPETQAEFLKKFAGVSEADVAALRSDQKYATFFSNVTAKPRAVLVFRGLGGRTAINQGLVMITQDISDDDNDPRKHPIRNLLDNKFTATEIIVEQPTGFHTFALFDGNGKRQDAAPDNVVKDHEVPKPYTARLQGAISCIRCHGANEGIQPVTNDVLIGKYLGERKNIDLDRAYALYSAALDKPFTRARDDYSDALVFLGSRYPIKERLTVVKASEHLSERYKQYWYTRVNAETALKELGHEVGEFDDPLKMLKELIPDQPIEDPLIIALKAGLSINRSEFEQIYHQLGAKK